MKSEFVVIAVVVSVLAAAVLLVLWLQKPDPLASAVVEGLAERQEASVPPVAPAPPAPVPVQRVESKLPPEPMSASLLFGFDRAELSSPEVAKLDRLLAKLQVKGVRFEAVGHADRIGPDSYNMRLSQRRAAAVKSYLVKREIDPNAVRTSAKGEREPASGDACMGMGPEARRNTGLVECLQPDRRVELTVLGAI